MKAKWIFQLACITVLIAAMLGSAQPVQAGVKDPPDHPGPYKAGFTFKLFYDTERTSPNTPEGGRPIPSYIFYPAAPMEGDMPPALYPNDPLGLLGGLDPTPSTIYEDYGIDPAYQEVPPATDGPFPLVVFSPGLTCPAELYFHFGARLASYGFVVVIFTNYGDGALGEPTLSEHWMAWTAIDRELDIKFTITEFLEMNEDPTSLLHGLIQPDQIAVSGHSWGGYAALGVVVPGGDPWFCEDEYEYPCTIVEFDPRIKVTLPLDSSSAFMTYEMMTQINIPHMTINREWNMIIEENSWPWPDPSVFARQHSAIQGQPNYRVDISESYHNLFTNLCGVWHMWHDYEEIPDDLFYELLTPFCYSSLEHAQEVVDLITMYMVAFLETQLAGEVGYQYLLTPGYALVKEPLVEFFVTEKQNGLTPKPDWPDYTTYFIHQPGTDQAKALRHPPMPTMEGDFLLIPR